MASSVGVFYFNADKRYMKERRDGLMRSLLVAVVVVVLSSAVSASFWPMFRGNLERSGYTNKTGDLAHPVVAWSVTLPNGVFSSPAVGDLDGDSKGEIIVCLDTPRGSRQKNVFAIRGNGSILWSFSTNTRIYSSPAIADLDGDGLNDVVFGTNRPEVYALRGYDGKELWKMNAKVGSFLSSPGVYDIDRDNNPEVLIGNTRGYLYAIDGESGIVEWRYHVNGSITSSPAIADLDGDDLNDVVFGASDGLLYVVNASGNLSWSVDLGSPVAFSTPAVIEDGRERVIVIGTQGGDLDIVSGGKIQKVFSTNGNISSSPGVAIIDGSPVIVFGTTIDRTEYNLYIKNPDNRIYGVDMEGRKLWEVETDGWSAFSSPALADIDRDGDIEAVVGTREGKVRAIDIKNGKVKWVYDGGTGALASPALADIDRDGNLEIVIAYLFSNQVKLLDSKSKPDLVIEGISFSNNFPEYNDVINISILVKNRGEAKAGNSTVLFYRRDPSLDMLIGNASIGRLDPGDRENATLEWGVVLPPGQVGIYAVVDGLNQVNESDERNNGAYRGFDNDLWVEGNLPVSIREAKSEVTTRVPVTISNQGRLDLSGVVAVINLEKPSGEEELDRKVIDIKAGEKKGVEFKITYIPSETSQNLSVVVDPENKIHEVDESNNRIVWSVERLKKGEEGTKEKGKEESKSINPLPIVLLIFVVVIIWKKAISKRIKRGRKPTSEKPPAKESLAEGSGSSDESVK